MAARKKPAKKAAKTKKTVIKASKPRSASKTAARSSRSRISAAKSSGAASKQKTASKSSKPASKSRDRVTKAKEKTVSPAKQQTRAKTVAKAEEAVRSNKVANSKGSAAATPALNASAVTSALDSKTKMTAPDNARATSETGPVKTEQSAHPASASVPPAVKAGSVPTAAVKPTSAAKPAAGRPSFKLNEFVVYPAHGVGQIIAVEEQEVAGFRLELYVISFSKDKMTLRVPTSKVAGVGLRKISDTDTAKRSLDILAGRARVKRTMWSRRAQEYESKINSGDIGAIAEVIRDLYRSDAQPEQSYSERQLYEAALDRLVREISAVQKLNEIDALKAVEAHLQKGHGRSKSSPAPVTEGGEGDAEIEQAA